MLTQTQSEIHRIIRIVHACIVFDTHDKKVHACIHTLTALETHTCTHTDLTDTHTPPSKTTAMMRKRMTMTTAMTMTMITMKTKMLY